MRQVFISYSSKEADQANKIVEALESQGIRCWIAPRNIGIGSNYMRAIPEGIRECPFFLLVLSEASQNSLWVEKELGQAIKQNKEIFPLMIENCAISDSFDFVLGNVQIRPYYREKDAAIREIVTRIGGQAEPSAKETHPQAPGGTVMDFWRQSAEQGNAGAQYSLGLFYQWGSGVPRDWSEAKKWYRKAADQGDEKAMKALEFMCAAPNQSAESAYEEGKKHYDAGRYTEAVEWYRKAAEQGFADAQCSLGRCFYNGQGVARNYENAVLWFGKAAERHHAGAQCILGRCYEQGLGVPRNYETAVKWYQKAAAQGNASAQYSLGVCFEHGRGVARKKIKAKEWYKKAAAQGYRLANEALERLK